MGTPSHSYGTSLAVWDHTVLPATRHKWTRPALTPANKWWIVGVRNEDDTQTGELTCTSMSHLVSNFAWLHIRANHPVGLKPRLSGLIHKLDKELARPPVTRSAGVTDICLPCKFRNKSSRGRDTVLTVNIRPRYENLPSLRRSLPHCDKNKIICSLLRVIKSPSVKCLPSPYACSTRLRRLKI